MVVPADDQRATAVNASQWSRVKEVYAAARAIPVESRAAFLAEVCGTDQSLHAEVESLLAQPVSAEGFLVETWVGRRIGAYEITSPLGAGGMGEVYRAHDTGLGRDVAVKMLPPRFAASTERLARFEREARVLASLNHPNIATIHGVLEVPGGGRALVMELIEGETLTARIASRAGSSATGLPTTETISIARQIARALEAAHEKGVLHRDLKPANIMVTPAGHVKVLDFGLAKVGVRREVETQSAPVSTEQGLILGTPAYMSPEQARGQPVDKRTDIWAFGCVLYEMLTARAAFSGDTVTDTLAAVLERDPQWAALPAATPPAIGKLLRRCLMKDVRDRLHDVADARLELDENAVSDRAAGTSPARPFARPLFQLLAVVLAGVVVSILLWSTRDTFGTSPTSPGRVPVHAAIELPRDALLAIGTFKSLGFDVPVLAISPAGTHVAYIGETGGVTRVFVRAMNGQQIRSLPGTEGAIHAFFSPDGQSVGFVTNDKVRRISVEGQQLMTIADANVPALGWWTSADTIYFSENQGGSLSRVPADGRERPTQVAALDVFRRFDSWALRYSDVLPDGRTLLVTTWPDGIVTDYAEIAALSLEPFAIKPLVRSGYGPRYVAPGYIVFGRGGDLMAVAFDADRLEVRGAPISIVRGATMESLFGHVQAAVSHGNAAVYVPGGDRAIGKPAFVDRQGNVEFLDMPQRVYGALDLSPDGRRLAIHVGDVADYIVVYDLARREERRLASGESEGWPVWNPDGTTLAFRRIRGRVTNPVLLRSPDDPSPAREVLTPRAIWTVAWLPKGDGLAIPLQNQLAFQTFNGGTHRTGLEATFPAFSPDGRWLAYASTGTGTSEIWAMSYPDGQKRRQISAGGGIEPLWCACGDIFYRHGNRWFSARVTKTEGDLEWERPRLAFETEFIDTPGLSYDVSRDGQRLLVVKRTESDRRDRIHVISPWDASQKPAH
jgi:serine/threonine-protein kinase